MNQNRIAGTVFGGTRLSIAAALLALLACLLAITQPARAAIYVVTNSNDSGLGSLRQAINDANNNPGADTITFAAATDGIPIFLIGAADEDGNASGDLDILVGGNLIIQGNGAANSIIDGGGIDRVFHICPGGGCTNTVTLNGVTIRNGLARYGSGVLIEGGTTTVSGSTVSDNIAADPGNGVGGGIFNTATLSVLNGSTIGGTGVGNSADIGGGIYSGLGSTTTVKDSTISDNTAAYNGGGIYNESGTTILDGSTISANAAYYGGGIFNRDGTTTVDGSTVSANTAVGGGGIFSELGGSTMVKDSTVRANMATSYGGGIYNTPTSSTTVDGSTVSANTVSYNGGGIYNRGTLNVQNGSTIGGAGVGNTAANGGGIYTNEGTMTVTGSRILHNTANNGGGVYNDSSIAGATSVTGSCIVGNSANSFFNNQPALQIATGNWWGAETGPNTPGADTTGGNVDASSYLTAPILGCALDLQVGKANDTSGNGTVGIPFHWTLTISNTGKSSATFGDSQTILVDDLPAGPTYGAPVAGSFVNIANSDNIQCSLADNTVTCTAAGGDVTLEDGAGSFEVTFSVTSSTPVTLVNPAGICQVDPDGHVTEGDENNNDCPENVVKVRYNLFLTLVPK